MKSLAEAEPDNCSALPSPPSRTSIVTRRRIGIDAASERCEFSRHGGVVVAVKNRDGGIRAVLHPDAQDGAVVVGGAVEVEARGHRGILLGKGGVALPGSLR